MFRPVEMKMIDDVRAAADAAVARLGSVSSLAEARQLETELLGKKGPFAEFKTRLGGLATVEEKKAVGQAVNEATQTVAAAVQERVAELKRAERTVRPIVSASSCAGMSTAMSRVIGRAPSAGRRL